MDDLQRATIIGASPTGVSSVLRSKAANWVMALFQQKKATSDSEINLWQQIAQQRHARVWAALAGDGLLFTPTFGTSGSGTTARIHAGSNLFAIIDGNMIDLRSSADSTTLDVTLPAGPASGSRLDYLYLRVSHEEVQPTASPEAASTTVYSRGNTHNSTPVTNDLSSPETSRRVQRRYSFQINQSAIILPGGATGYSISTERMGGSNATTTTSLDGLWRAIPLATITRISGASSIAPASLSAQYRVIKLAISSDRVDGLHASSTRTAGLLLPLDSAGKFPVAAFSSLPGATNAAQVDGFDAYAAGSAVASHLAALDGSAKIPNTLVRTGSGNGLDADTVDGYDAAATPTANTLLALNSGGKYPIGVLPAALAADTVDSYHANATPTTWTMLPLDGSAKIPNSVLRTGHTFGLDAGLVDGCPVTTNTPFPGIIPALDGNGKIAHAFLKAQSGNGMNVDTVDGRHASDLALVGHTHPAPSAAYQFQFVNHTYTKPDSLGYIYASSWTYGPFFDFPTTPFRTYIWGSVAGGKQNGEVPYMVLELCQYTTGGAFVSTLASTRSDHTFPDGLPYLSNAIVYPSGTIPAGYKIGVRLTWVVPTMVSDHVTISKANISVLVTY